METFLHLWWAINIELDDHVVWYVIRLRTTGEQCYCVTHFNFLSRRPLGPKFVRVG